MGCPHLPCGKVSPGEPLWTRTLPEPQGPSLLTALSNASSERHSWRSLEQLAWQQHKAGCFSCSCPVQPQCQNPAALGEQALHPAQTVPCSAQQSCLPTASLTTQTAPARVVGRIRTAKCFLPHWVFRDILSSLGNSKQGVIISREVFEGHLLGAGERNFHVRLIPDHSKNTTLIFIDNLK